MSMKLAVTLGTGNRIIGALFVLAINKPRTAADVWMAETRSV
jgi:hypothetical protein